MKRMDQHSDNRKDELTVIRALKTMDTADKQKILDKIELLKAVLDDHAISPSISKQEKQ